MHRLLYAASGVLIMKDDLYEVVGYVPDHAVLPKVVGWVLAGAAFTRLLLGSMHPDARLPRRRGSKRARRSPEVPEGPEGR